MRVADRGDATEGAKPFGLAAVVPVAGSRRADRLTAKQKQCLGGGEVAESADDDALRERVVRWLQLPGQPPLPGRFHYRSLAHAAASSDVSVCLRSPSAMRACRSI